MLPSWLSKVVDQPPKPIAPHVIQQPRQLPGPPVVLGEPPSPTEGAARIAAYFYKEARKRGKSEADAAGIARGQAMNFLARLGIFKPQPKPYEL